MDELRLGDQLVRYDREATTRAYSEVPSGGAEQCGCSGCRNFVAQRNAAYPPGFLSLLDQLGIDPAKEGEAYEMGPTGEGYYLYGGWFYFVGELVEPGERNKELSQDFHCYFSTSFPAAKQCFGSRVVAVEFVTKVPWVLGKGPA